MIGSAPYFPTSNPRSERSYYRLLEKSHKFSVRIIRATCLARQHQVSECVALPIRTASLRIHPAASLTRGVNPHCETALQTPWISRAYLMGLEPVTRISTSLLALCCQSGLVATLATPTRARRRSIGSRSFRMSPFLIARFTRERSASCI